VVQTEREAAHLSATETALLSRIDPALPHEWCDRIAALRDKREGESISDADWGEFSPV
jgi:hypothetical protein